MSGLLNIINASTMLGLGSDILEAIGNLVGDIIGLFLWTTLSNIFFVILDLFEGMFRAFAGISEGGVTVHGTNVEGDIVLHLIQSDLVQNIFTSVLVLSLFLLIIFTIFAIVKNIYSDKQEPTSKIINNSIKALLMYLLVPVATIVCLLVGNVVLQAVDGATKSGATTTSGTLFIAAAYNANRLRDDNIEDCRTDLLDVYDDFPKSVRDEISAKTQVGSSDDVKSASRKDLDTIATIIDENFVNGTLGGGGQWSIVAVSTYYDSFRLSYLTVWVGGAFLIGAIGKITWGLVSRVFKMTLYFALSPAVMATFPLDGGKALGSWRGEMVKNGTMAITAVGVLNVLYSILPVFNNIDIGTFVGGWLIKLFITLISFSSAKDLIGTISGWFGTGDAFAEGVKAKETATKPIKNAAKKGLALTAGAYAGAKKAKEHGGNRFAGAVTGMFAQTDMGKPLAEAREVFDKGKANAEKAYKDRRTRGLLGFGAADDDKLAEYEGREAVMKENKRIDREVSKVYAKRDAQIAKLDTDDPLYKDKKKEIEEQYEKVADKIRASASYIDTLMKEVQEELAEKKKKLEERKAKAAPFSEFNAAKEQDDAYLGIISKMLKTQGVQTKDLTASQWGEMKRGNFSSFGTQANTAEKIFSTYAPNVLDNETRIDMARERIRKMVEPGGDGSKVAMDLLGDNFEKMFTVIKENGVVKGYAMQDQTTNQIATAVKQGLEGVDKAIAEVEQKAEDLITERLDAFKNAANLSKENLIKIGKNSGTK